MAGALLGCKLGFEEIAKQVPTWLTELKHKSWLEKEITRFYSCIDLVTNSFLESTVTLQRTVALHFRFMKAVFPDVTLKILRTDDKVNVSEANNTQQQQQDLPYATP